MPVQRAWTWCAWGRVSRKGRRGRKGFLTTNEHEWTQMIILGFMDDEGGVGHAGRIISHEDPKPRRISGFL